MKYLIIFLCYLTLSQATLFNFWRTPAATVEKESIPIENNEKYNPEELQLYNKIYATNGYGYYPQQINYPTIYSHIPIQGLSPQFLTYSPSSAVHILPDIKQPIIIPDIPSTLTDDEIKTTHQELPLHISDYGGIPIVEKEIIHQDELPLENYENFNNNNNNNNNGASYLTETHHPSANINLSSQLIDGIPGQYSNSYVLSDGTKVFEEGHLKKSINGNDVIVKSGHYEYKTENGDLHKVNWIADEDGFRILE